MSKSSEQSFINFVRHLKLEAVSLAFLMTVLFVESSAPLWLLPASFLLFDLGMIGYIKSPRIGALTYNISHSLILPSLCIATGAIFDYEALKVLGYLWSFHIGVDRALGYGLKQQHSFYETHLGFITKKKR